MSHSVQMPALGESVTEGTVTRWLRSEGETVNEDEPLLEVSTDKVDTEVPAPYSGVLEKILVGEDETVEVGAELAIIGDGSGSGDDSGNGDDAAAGPADATAPAPSPEPSGTDPAPAEASDANAAPAPVAAPPASDSAATAQGAEPDGGTATGTEVTMPAMGESVTEGTISQWLKSVGDSVAVDEPLVEVSTDKVDAEVPSPVAGTLLKILAAEDETVDIGAAIAVIGDASGSAASGSGTGADAAPPPAPAPEPEPEPEPAPAPDPAPEAGPGPAPDASAPSTPPTSPPTQAGAPTPAPAGPAHESAPAPAGAPSHAPAAPAARSGYVTPVVRKLAADKGVDLSTVEGTGVGGRIRREDVLAAAKAREAAAASTPPAAPSPDGAASGARTTGPIRPDTKAAALVGTTQPADRIRQAIAQSALHAVTTTAQVTMVAEIDVTRIVALRDRARAARAQTPLSVLPFFVKAAVESAKAHPIINASLSEDVTQITYHPSVNVGIEVDTDRGSVVPVIHRADELTVAALADRIADLAQRTRGGNIGPDELSGATLTVANAGSVGALYETAIVVPPQSATVVVGSVVKRPVVTTDGDGNDVIAVRSMANLALSYDHRAVDGADAARYLAAVKDRLEGGSFEADLGF